MAIPPTPPTRRCRAPSTRKARRRPSRPAPARLRGLAAAAARRRARPLPERRRLRGARPRAADGRGVFEEAAGHRYEGTGCAAARRRGRIRVGDGAFCYSGTWKGRRAAPAGGDHGSTYGGWACSTVRELVDTAGNQYEGEFQQGRKHGPARRRTPTAPSIVGMARRRAPRYGPPRRAGGEHLQRPVADGVPSGEGRAWPRPRDAPRVFADGKPHGWGGPRRPASSARASGRGAALRTTTLKYDDGRRYAGLLKGASPVRVSWWAWRVLRRRVVRSKRAGRASVFRDGSVPTSRGATTTRSWARALTRAGGGCSRGQKIAKRAFCVGNFACGDGESNMAYWPRRPQRPPFRLEWVLAWAGAL